MILLTARQVRERREALAKALESGEYTQIKSSLRKGRPFEAKSMCFGGVMCDVADPTKWKNITGDFWSYDGGAGYPPQTVQRHFGFTLDEMSKLMRENDRGVAFGELVAAVRALPLPEDVL